MHAHNNMRALVDHHQPRPPWLLRFRSSTAFIIATVWTSSFTDFLLYAMIVPIMPTALVERANIPYEDREYWTSVLLTTEAAVAFVCCPTFGYWIDAAPTRRLPYLLGLIFLAASMALMATAKTIPLFVVARLLQGGATAMVAVAGLALLTDSVSFENLGQTIGYQGSAVALGFLLGPLLGGLVYDTAGYHAVFVMAAALVGVDLIMRVAVIEKPVASKWAYLPSTDEEEEVEEEEEEEEEEGGRVPPYHENQLFAHRSSASSETESPASKSTRKPLALFLIVRQPRVLISSYALFVQGILYSAFDSTMPVFVETYFNWTPLGAGLVFLPSALTAIFEPYFGSISDRHGTRPITFLSFLLLTIPLICLRLVTQNTTSHIILLLSFLTLIGLLMNFALPALYVETQQVLEEMEHASPGIFGEKGAVAQALGIQTMAQFLGMAVGPLWGGFVEWRFGWKMMSLSLGVLAGVTALPMLWLSSTSSSSFAFTNSSKNSSRDEDGHESERERLLG